MDLGFRLRENQKEIIYVRIRIGIVELFICCLNLKF